MVHFYLLIFNWLKSRWTNKRLVGWTTRRFVAANSAGYLQKAFNIKILNYYIFKAWLSAGG